MNSPLHIPFAFLFEEEKKIQNPRIWTFHFKVAPNFNTGIKTAQADLSDLCVQLAENSAGA